MPRKKKKTAPAKEEPEVQEEEEYRSPVQILEVVEQQMGGLTTQLAKVITNMDNQQDSIYRVISQVGENIKNQTLIMNDFATQVGKLTRTHNVWDNLTEVMFQQTSKVEEDRKQVQTYRRETRAVAKEAIHHLDILRNALIDLQHIWHDE